MNTPILKKVLLIICVFAVLGVVLYKLQRQPSSDFYSYYHDLPITPVPNNALCWNAKTLPTPAGDNQKRLKDLGDSAADSNPGSSGVAYQLDSLTNGTLIGEKTFLIKPDTNPVAYFSVYNPAQSNGTTLSLQGIALLDEHQITVQPVNQELQNITPYTNFTLGPKNIYTVSVHVPKIAKGVHELIMLWITKPQSDQEFQLASIGETSVATRVTLIVEDPIDSVPRPISPLPIDNNSNAPFLNLSLGQPFKQWALPEKSVSVASDETLNFYSEAKYDAVSTENDLNLTDQPEKIAFLLFLDGIQIGWSDGKLLTYVIISKMDDYVRIPEKLKFTPHSGRHEIMVTRINYPGIPICFMSGNPEGIILPYWIKSSIAYLDAR